MHKRILFGLVAWLLGAATATAGSLLAVSLLGQGIGGSSAQQLTEDAVNRALASEVAESQTAASAAASARPASRPARPSPTLTPDQTAASPAATQNSQGTQPTQGPQNTPSTQGGGGTVFTSKGGDVVAGCQASGAYLISWSPLQGYEIDSVVRGPAAAARVTFESTSSQVTMVVTCSAGVPSVTTPAGADN